MSLFPHYVLAVKDKWIQHATLKKTAESLKPFTLNFLLCWWIAGTWQYWLSTLFSAEFMITWAKELCLAELEGDI